MIALYVHPKNSNHRWSHSKAIMALDHSRLGLENKFFENKSGRIFWVRQVYNLLYKILPTSLGTCKPTFYTFYTSHLRWNSTIYHTDLGQNAVFHNFSWQSALSQYSGRSILGFLIAKPFKKFPKSILIRPAGSHFWRAPNLHWTLTELRFNIIKNLLTLFLGFYNDV